MSRCSVVWSDTVIEKLNLFHSKHFTAEETYDFVVQLTMEVEDLLLNKLVSKTYTEEFGDYKGMSRVGR